MYASKQWISYGFVIICTSPSNGMFTYILPTIAGSLETQVITGCVLKINSDYYIQISLAAHAANILVSIENFILIIKQKFLNITIYT